DAGAGRPLASAIGLLGLDGDDAGTGLLDGFDDGVAAGVLCLNLCYGPAEDDGENERGPRGPEGSSTHRHVILSGTWQPAGLRPGGPWLSVPASRRVWPYRLMDSKTCELGLL